MKPLTKIAKNAVVALALLSFASAPFAQDETEEKGGGWFSGVTSFFSNLFSSDDEGEEAVAAEAEAESDAAGGGGFGGLEWYAGAEAGVAKHESRALHSSRAYGAYGGGIFGNRLGFELGYMDLGDAEIRGGGGDLKVDGFRGGLTLSSEAGDGPVRLGVGYYSVDADIGGFSESSSGLTVGVKFEQAVTEHLYLTLGTDFLFSAKIGGERSDAIVFGIGLSFHTSPPALAEAEDEGGIGVTEPAYEDSSEEPAAVETNETPETYETPSVEEVPAEEPAMDETGSGEPFVDEPAEEPYE